MEAERQLSIVNPQPQRLPGPELLHRLLFGADDSVTTANTQPALDYRAPDGTRLVLSYSELDKAARTVAAEIGRRLARLSGADEPFVVPILIPQAPELYVSQLGTLQAGGAFCPIQLDAPPDRIRFIANDVAARVILTTRELSKKLPSDLALQTILVDELPLFGRDAASATATSPSDEFAPVRAPVAEDLAYVMYTSGSTGTPKGVGVPHLAASQSLLAHDRHVPAFRRFLQFAAPTFDVSVFEIFFPLFRGVTLVSCSRADMLDDLPAVIRSMDVDACELTPTVAGSLLRSRENAPGLRLLLTIGEMLTEPVVREFGDGPGRPSILWAMYGPTEAAIHCTLQPALLGSASVKNIGFPLDTVSAYILAIPEEEQENSSGDPVVVPMGEVGELAVGGYQLARGYINRPEQTAAAFIDTEKYGRLYRTGDKARITPEGTLECSGRLTGGQVKLRGQRIELGEIEQAVLRTSGCLGSVASVINGVLVAFCDMGSSLDNASDLEEKVLKSCRSWLPRFMVPGDVVLMPDFPRLASGKVDRRRLQDEYISSRQTSALALPSNSPAVYKDDLHRQLHQVAANVLGSGIDDNASLSSAGMDSLQAIRFASLLRASGLRDIGAVDVLNAKTLLALHRQWQQHVQQGSVISVPRHNSLEKMDIQTVLSSSSAAAIKASDVEHVAVCSPVQTSMLAETLTDARAYCNWIELEIAGEGYPSKVVSFLEQLIRKNEALRTGFLQYDGSFVQVVWKQALPGQIQLVDSFTRDFRLASDEDLLRPLRIQVLRPAQGDNDSGGSGGNRLARSTRIVLCIHHAIYDGWSMDLLKADLSAMVVGTDASERLAYRHVADYDLARPLEQTETAEQFWAQFLSGFQPSPVPDLNPRHEPNAPVLTTTVTLDEGEAQAVYHLAKEINVAPQAVFQAALMWLWSSLVGSSDVTVGTVTSGRTLPLDGIESAVGPCLHTVPLRVNLSQALSVRDLLASIHSANRNLLPFSFLPLASIKKVAGLRPGQPLFDILFVYQESLYSRKATKGPVREVAHQDYLETKLLWEVEPDGPQFHFRATFHSDAFPKAQVQSFLDQFSHLVRQMSANPDENIAAILPSFPQQLLSCHNLDYRPFNGCPDLATLVQTTADQVPERPAVCFATSLEAEDSVISDTLSFRELNCLANRIARLLHSNGALIGDTVAIIMNKSALFYAGILGILKAGCTYLPLLPTLPTARASLIFEQAGVRHCLTDTETLQSLVCHLPTMSASIDLQTAAWKEFSGDNLTDIPSDPERPAYVVFTSGSTGVPKGVSVTQLNICSNLDVLSRLYPRADNGRLLQSCAQNFDVSVFEIFFTWISGMCLCSATNDILFHDLERAIRLLGVTHLSMTPTVAGLVNPEKTPLVSFIVTAGEPLSEKVARTWTKQLFQGYGPTEVTNICTVKKMTEGDMIRHLGFGFENTSSVVLHQESEDPVPLGSVGELCFGGDQVAAGYLNMPSLTDEKFIQHPLYGRLYRSGDIGRMLPDGSLMITGRIDDQIKLRGQRIELNEINMALRESEVVSEALTLLLHHETSNSEHLASFFVPLKLSSTSCEASSVHILDISEDAETSNAIKDLFYVLESRLPSYMVPTFAIPVSAIPVTPAGKVNRALLKDMFQRLTQDQLRMAAKPDEEEEGNDTDSSWSRVERQTAKIITDALGADLHSLGRWTPLASLGLDSLSAIQVSKMLQQRFGQQVAISKILKNACVARLAQIIERAASAQDEDQLLPYSLNVFSTPFLSEIGAELQSRNLTLEKVLPCTPLQEGMLVSPIRGKSYINKMLFRLHAPDDLLREAWIQACERHAILRTCFVTTDSMQHPIAQIVLAGKQAPWMELGAAGSTTGNSIDSLVDAHAKTLSNPVDSFQPPVSFGVIRHADVCYLSFVCHHAIYDGEAMQTLLSEVEQLFHGQTLTPETPLSFDSFLSLALAQPKTLDEFWKTQLAGFRSVLLQPCLPSTAPSSGVVTRTLSPALSAIQSQSRDLGFSLLTTFQSAWACVWHLVSDSRDVCFGNVYNGRSVPLRGVEHLVAPCFNTLPARVNLSELRSGRDVMAYFQALNPDMVQHQFTPLRHIQRQFHGGSRLFDSLLLLQQPSRLIDDSIWSLERDDGEMDIPLVCELSPNETQDQMGVSLYYDQSYVSAEAASSIMELFESILGTLLAYSSSHIPTREHFGPRLQGQLDGLNLSFRYPPEEASDSKTVSADLEPLEYWPATESIVRSVLARLSGVPLENIRRDTTIYRLGLDSVRAVQVASLLRKQGISVSAVDVMEYPSCMALGKLLAKGSEAPASNMSNPSRPSSPNAASAGSLSTITTSPASSASTYDFARFRSLTQPVLDRTELMATDIEAILPCTPLQSGLLAEFIRSKGQHYFNFLTLEMDTSAATGVTVASWAKAWRDAAACFPMLRSGFVGIDMEDNSSISSPFAIVQLSSRAANSEYVRVLTVAEAQFEKFDAQEWRRNAATDAMSHLHLPPWQVALLEDRQKGTATCHLAIHHALYDASSLSIILDAVSSSVRGHGIKVAPPTEAVVSDILHQVSVSVSPPSGLDAAWKEKASRLVVNKFPVLTPLKVSPGVVRVASKYSPADLSSLDHAINQSGFTMHAVLQAAWTRILSSFVGDKSVVFGSVLSGRNSDATANAVFPCLSTLPVVCENDASNRSLVEQLMKLNIMLQKSQHIPLGQLQKWLGQPDSHLFDTLLVYQKLDSGSMDAEHLPSKHPWKIMDETAIVDYSISLEAMPRDGDRLEYQITYDNSVLPDDQANLLLRQFDATVRHLAFHPDSDEDELVTMEPDLFSALPAKQPELKSDIQLMHQFVESQAEKNPDKIALQFVTAFDSLGQPVSQSWSYAGLNSRGNIVADVVSRVADPGQIVAVCFDKCPEAFFAILGILKAGCSFLALDPTAPSARKEFIMQDSGAVLLLTDVSRAREPTAVNGLYDSDNGVPIAAVDETELATKALAARVSGSFPPDRRETLPSDVCYCLYTSGTTGTPKGCAITHENAVQAMLAFQVLFRDHWDEDSRWLQFASFHFDVSVLEQYWTWSVGLTVVGAPRDLILEDLARTISRLGITHIDLTPSLGRLLDPKDVPSLCRGVFITGGEPLKQEMLDSWGPTGAVHNFYGPTEATIGVTSFPQVPRNGRASNIGRQFPNVGSFVLKPGTQTPVLRGGVGELCVSGKLVGKEYLNRRDLTLERFPTLREKDYPGYGERIYRTGDLVRLLYDGCFDFLGRADDQVKLRGQRLEIGEINHAIRLGVGPSIADIATLVFRDAQNNKDFLVSFVVESGPVSSAVGSRSSDGLRIILGEEAALLARKVQAACRKCLPAYMVPTYVAKLPFMPLSANNKAEAKELKRLFGSLSAEERLGTAGVYGASTPEPELLSSPVGAAFLGALRQLSLLGENESLDPGTNIFDLGIDSISVLRFARALKRAGLSATPALVLSHPTVGDLVSVLESQKGTLDSSSIMEARLLVDACQHRNSNIVCEALGVGYEQVEYIAPCSALQLGIISRSESGPEHRKTYYKQFVFQLEPDTSVLLLKEAWQKVISAQAILRTRFISTREGYVQCALRAPELPWKEVACVGGSQGCQHFLDESREQWVNGNQEGGNITKPFEILNVNGLLVLHIFHALYDAVSLDLLLGQVSAAYVGDGGGSQAEVPTFLEALVHGPLKDYSASRPFWEAHLKGSLLKPLPSLWSSIPSTNDISAVHTIPFSALDNLRSLLGVTHSALVQALWISVLYKIYGSNVTMGLVLSGRTLDTLDNAEEVVGPLFNTLPFHMRRRSGKTWADLVRECHAFNTSILPFQQVPLRDIQKWCSSGKPLFDTLLSFQFSKETPQKGEKLWTETQAETHADYPLALEVVLKAEEKTGDGQQPGPLRLQLLLVAKRGFADAAALQRIIADFEEAANALVENPHQPISGSTDISSDLSPDGASAFFISPPEVQFEQSQENLPKGSKISWEGDAAVLRREMASLSGSGLQSIQEHTTLLELGLDSVDAIKLSARLRDSGIRLTAGQLIRGQCISEFLRLIATESRNGADEMASAIAKDKQITEQVMSLSAALAEHLSQSGRTDLSSVDNFLPPTPLQEAMVADMIQSDFTRYFNHDILELAPGTDTSRLKEAWAIVVQENPILRTGFIQIESPNFDAAFCQAIWRDNVRITEQEVESEEDLARITELARETAAKAHGERHLLQLCLAHITSESRRFLVFSIAHALYDGWSLELIHQAVQKAYRTRLRSPGAAADKNLHYVRHLGLVFQSSSPQSDTFWRGFLADAQPTFVKRQTKQPLPTKGKKSVIRMEKVSSVSATDIQSFCKSQSTSIQVVGQTCWAATLATLTGSLDVIFGVVLSGRDSEGSEEIMFPTMNTVPIRAVLHGTVPELLRYMQANMTSVFEYQHCPLRKTQRHVVRNGAEAESGGIFNTLFIFQKHLVSQDSEVGGGALNGDGEPLLMKSVKGIADVEYPICVEMEIVSGVDGESIVWRAACDDSYVTEYGAARLLYRLDVALRFLMRASGAESGSGLHALRFEDDGVSVCGLPTISLELSKRESDNSSEVKSDGASHGEWTEAEMAIRSVLAAVSGVPELSIQRTGQTLYHLGLDSISAIKASTLLKKTKGIHLSVRDLVTSGSIQEMASRYDGKQQEHDNTKESTQLIQTLLASLDSVRASSVVKDAGIDQANVVSLLPATAMQVHMVSVWQVSGGQVFFPEFHYRLRGVSGGRRAIYNAWRMLLAEFPILRTVLLATASKSIPLLQVVLRLPSVAEGAWKDGEWPALGPLAGSFASLSVSAGAEEDEWLLSLKIHHSLYDAVSLPNMLHSLRQLCGRQELPFDESDGELSLTAWSRLTAQQHSRGVYQEQKDFWTGFFQNTAVSTTTTSSPVSPVGVSTSRVSHFQPEAMPDITALRAVASKHGLSIQSIFFAAYAKTLCREKVQDDAVFGVYLANREGSIQGGDSAVESLARYPMLSLAPLRVLKPAEHSLLDVAFQIQQDILAITSSPRPGSPAFSTAGLWQIQEWTGVCVGSFINFLLPDEASKFSDATASSSIAMEEMDEPQDGETFARPDFGPSSYAALGQNPVLDAYGDYVDVEAAIRGDKLDIGVFGPPGKLGEKPADLIQRLVDILEL